MPSYRIPGNTRNISDGWATHVARGSLGGTDFTDSYGTPIHAQSDGYVSIVDNSSGGSGGRYVRVTYGDGSSTECLHASSIIASRGQSVSKGQIIGYSGASAYGSDYGTGGPHIHNHGVWSNGVRFDVVPYLDDSSSSTAGGGYTPIETEEDKEEDELMAAKDEIMQHAQAVANNLLTAFDQRVEAVKEVVRRESRYRAFKNTKTGAYVLVSWDTGNIFGPTNNMDFLRSFAQENIVSMTDIERAVLFDDAQFKTLLEHAAIVRKQS